MNPLPEFKVKVKEIWDLAVLKHLLLVDFP